MAIIEEIIESTSPTASTDSTSANVKERELTASLDKLELTEDEVGLNVHSAAWDST